MELSYILNELAEHREDFHWASVDYVMERGGVL